jgi:hypothetical protein
MTMQQNRMFHNISSYNLKTGRAMLLSFKFFVRFLLLGSTVLFLSVSSVKAAVIHDEGVGGDLASNLFNLDSAGTNTFSGTTQSGSGSTDSDTFFVTLAAGLQITDFLVEWSDPTTSDIDFSFSLLSIVFSPTPVTTLLESSTYSTSADTASESTLVAPAHSGAFRYVVGSGASGNGESTISYKISIETGSIPAAAVTHMPVPAAFWLFGSALLGFVGMSRKTKI